MSYSSPEVEHFREIRTTGNSLNAGCFVDNNQEGWSTVGVDRSQADSAFLISGASGFAVTTTPGATWGHIYSLTVAGGHTVSTDDIGNFVLVSAASSSEAYTGLFCIDAINSVGSNTWHMTKPVRTQTANTATYTLTARMGGAWPNLGFIETIAGRDDWRCSAAYVKSGTYALTTTSVNSDGGPYQPSDSNRPINIIGYNSTRGDKGVGGRPLLTVGSTGYTGTMLKARGYRGTSFQHLEINGGGTATGGIYVDAYSIALIVDCKITNMDTSSGKAFYGRGMCLSCEASGGGDRGFHQIGASRSVAHGVSTGFYQPDYNVSNCLAYDCTTGFIFKEGNYGVTGFGNTADDCTTGFNHSGNTLANCIASNCTTGFDASSVGSGVIDGGFYNNTTNVDSDVRYNLNPITCASDPYVDASSRDYRLNTSATGGALLADKGYGIPGQTDYRDVGAVLTEPSGSGGGGTTVPQGLHSIESGINA